MNPKAAVDVQPGANPQSTGLSKFPTHDSHTPVVQVTGLQVRPGVDPETAVAVGAALHAGPMVGAVGGGVELNDEDWAALAWALVWEP